MSEESVKKLCVTQRGDKWYYPKSIPQKRRNGPTFMCVLTMLTIMSVHYLLTSTTSLFLLGLYVNSFLVLFLGEILHRIYLIWEETNHLISRYENNLNNLLTDGFKLSSKTYIALAFSVVYSVYFVAVHGLTYKGDVWEVLLCVMPTMYFAKIVLELDSGPLSDAYWIQKDNGLDYGSGMAYSFFHGYLAYLLPKTGTAEKNVEEHIIEYEDENNVTFGSHKIFILIPKSLKCYVSLCDASKVMESRSSLKEKQLTVAGVRDRVYKNSVYSIKTKKGSFVYVCAEYATPLRTFEKVFDADGDHTEYYKRHKNDILLQFYLTLKDVLERNGWDRYCELVYYEDTNKDKKPHDVGQILLSRMIELKKHGKTEHEKEQ